MNGVGLPTVGRLLGHRQRDTTAIYAHLDAAALRDAAMQAATVIARAMQYVTGPPIAPEVSMNTATAEQPDPGDPLFGLLPEPLDSIDSGSKCGHRDKTCSRESAKAPPQLLNADCLPEDTSEADTKPASDDARNFPSRSRDVDWLWQVLGVALSASDDRSQKKSHNSGYYLSNSFGSE